MVFDQYHQKLYFFILHKTQSAYIAEEVMQLAFIKLWESRHTLNDQFTISTQLYRIAGTVLIDLLRKQQTGGLATPAAEAPVIELAAAQGASARMDEKELQQRIIDAVGDLPPVRRQVFTMSRGKGMSYQEIADSLAISVKTVESHIYKALKQIRKYLTVLWLIALQLFFLIG